MDRALSSFSRPFADWPAALDLVCCVCWGEGGGLQFADWQAVIDINLGGVFLCSQAAAKVPCRKGRTQTNSQAGQPTPWCRAGLPTPSAPAGHRLALAKPAHGRAARGHGGHGKTVMPARLSTPSSMACPSRATLWLPVQEYSNLDKASDEAFKPESRRLA